MLISLNWIKEFVDVPDKSPQELGDDLTVRTFEVEEVIDQAAMYDKMVVGEITQIQDHPDADKLKICATDIGQAHPAQIVCGGLNIYEGMKVAVALIGSKVRWHGEGDLVDLKKAKIRGMESQGMICAACEIGLSDEHPIEKPYVMDLKIEAKSGTPLAKALGLDDAIIDVDNKSITNRPDLWGHRGIAREMAAIYGSKLTVNSYKLEEQKELDGKKEKLGVKIENSDLCPRYLALKMDNIKVTESPDWLKQRLQAIGQRPINNLVDISNLVMFELGQPVHVFDGKKVSQVVVRNAKKGELIKTLDGQERKLSSEMLVITDSKNTIAIAGVMGGANSEVDDSTTSIIIESANFEPISIRQTANKLNLRSEASARFEKGLDPHLAEESLYRVAQLVKELIPESSVVSEVADVGEWPSQTRSKGENIKIETSLEFIQKRLGIVVVQDKVTEILEFLGFEVSEVDGNFVVLVPSFRSDIKIPEDIVEEVGRIYGYNEIAGILPATNIKGDEQTNVNLALERKIKNYLTLAAGLQETESHIFDYQPVSEKMGIDLSNRVEIENPLAEGQEFLRKSLLPHLVKQAKENLRFYDNFGLFEIGRIFRSEPSPEFTKSKKSKDALPDQPKRLAVILASKSKSKSEVFFELKDIASGMLGELKINCSYKYGPKISWLEASKEAEIMGNGQHVGELGLLNPNIIRYLKTESIIGVIYLNYDFLIKIEKNKIKYTPIPEFPAVTRDIAIIVEDGVKYADLEKAIRNSSKLLEKVELFDVYEGKQVSTGRRSLAWHLSFRDAKKTLTSEEADKELAKIIKTLEKNFDATLRS